MMTLDDINIILRKGEGTRIEYKESRASVPSDLYETVVSFSNTEGGTIILGANDDGNVTGINPGEVSRIKTNIVTALNEKNCINPAILASPEDFDHPEGKLIILKIPVSSLVHNHAGKIYWRDADADIDITQNQIRISELFLKKRNTFTESQIYQHLSMADLHEDLFDKARAQIRGYQPTHPWVSASNEQILNESSLLRKDYETGQKGLTLAAALIFGKDSTIQNILPAYKIDAMVRKDNPDRYDDRLLLRTNLIDSYIQLLDFIKKHLSEKFFTENGQRKDLRELIFREVIGNLIVHREYTDAHTSELIIYKDKVIATNPNIPHFSGPIDPNNFNPYPKNPNIRKFFTAFGWTEEIGSGIRNTYKYLQHYIPGAQPLFYENNPFKTEIPLIVVTLDKFTDQLIQWLDFPEYVKEHVSGGLHNIYLDPALSEANWESLLLHLVPSWHRKGAKLPELDWPKKQVLTAEKIKKVPSWSQKGAKLMHKKALYLVSLLTLCSRPMNIEKMMNIMNYKKRQSFREIYLIPLQESRLLTMTIPDKPRTPEQKYAITEKGKLFLAGRDFES